MNSGKQSTTHMGTNIKTVREILGISRDLLALEFHVSIAAIEKMEKRKIVSKQVIARLSEIFHVEHEQIEDFEESRFLVYIGRRWHKDKH